MRRNYRSLLKWILLAGILAIFFKLCCDILVDISIGNIKDSTSDVSYESSLIAWAATDPRLKKRKFAMKYIKERNDLQLIGAQIFFRHGARTPLNLLPNLEEVYYKN